MALSCLMPGRTRSMVQDDQHYLVIDGRRWRRSDPSIPEPLRAELVYELMDARRTVGAAKRAGDDDAVRIARSRVHDAKMALGERGLAWWEPHGDAALGPRIEAAARALLRRRGAGKTICPSDIARIVGGEQWRKRMQTVRAMALELVQAGALELRQKGKVVRPEYARGPIRLGLPGADVSGMSALGADTAGAKPASR